MSFADTYREEVVESRRARGRTARFVGRLIGFVLALAFMATLQSQPELRQAMMEAGMRGVGAVMGVDVATSDEGSELAPRGTTTLPRSRVPVIRGGERVSDS